MTNQSQTHKENLYHLALILSKKISTGTISGNEKLTKLLEKYTTFEQICQNEWGDLLGFENNMFNEIPSLEKKMKEINQTVFDYEIITINDEKYPEYLKLVKGSSPVLYFRGNIELLNQEKSIAVVGSRKPSQTALSQGNKVIQRLVNKDYLIVSGLAQGSDTLAHQKAIEYNGNTIAILGTPLNKFGVKKNQSLQEQIANEHLLISQFPIGYQTIPPHFAHRNTTTVGLAKNGIVVIEAMDNSGTLNAIRECTDNNKDLFVLENNLKNNCEWISNFESQIKIVR